MDVPIYDGKLGPCDGSLPSCDSFSTPLPLIPKSTVNLRWDGPGFICNGRPIMIYNSHATAPAFGEQTKTAAFPADDSDPLLTDWIHAPLDPPTAFIGSVHTLLLNSLTNPCVHPAVIFTYR